jgi:hypothetical protein
LDLVRDAQATSSTENKLLDDGSEVGRGSVVVSFLGFGVEIHILLARCFSWNHFDMLIKYTSPIHPSTCFAGQSYGSGLFVKQTIYSQHTHFDRVDTGLKCWDISAIHIATAPSAKIRRRRQWVHTRPEVWRIAKYDNTISTCIACVASGSALAVG